MFERVMCASCEIEVSWPPVIVQESLYCCEGCAAGGPCCCSYDSADQMEEEMSMNMIGALPAIPMTAGAYRSLEAEVERIVSVIRRTRSGAGWGAEDDGREEAIALTATQLATLAQRHDALRRVLASARIVEHDGSAVVGSRVTWREPDGSLEDCVLVAPGEADPLRGRISPESPLGAALLGARPGTVVEVDAPSGRRRMEITGIE